MYSAFLRRKPVADCSSPLEKRNPRAGRQCLSLPPSDTLRYNISSMLFLRRYHDPLCGTHHPKNISVSATGKTGIPSRRILHCRTLENNEVQLSLIAQLMEKIFDRRLNTPWTASYFRAGASPEASRPTKRTTLRGKGLEPATQARRLVSLTAPRYADTDRRHRRRLGNTCSTYPSG